MSMTATYTLDPMTSLSGENFLEAVCMAYMPLVRRVARRMQKSLPRHVESDDLVSAGVVGLLGAAQRYQEDRSVPFSAFAQIRIRGAILDFLREEDWAPRDLRRRGRAIDAATQNAAQRVNGVPEEADVALQLGMSVEKLRASRAELRLAEIGSLHEATDPEAERMPIDSVVDTRDLGALTYCLEKEARQQLAISIEALPERQRLVITLYYYEELTMNEIAEVMGIGESRVSQLRSAAVRTLRSALGSQQ